MCFQKNPSAQDSSSCYMSVAPTVWAAEDLVTKQMGDEVPICNLYSENETFWFQAKEARVEQEPDGLHGNKKVKPTLTWTMQYQPKRSKKKISCFKISGKFLQDNT